MRDLQGHERRKRWRQASDDLFHFLLPLTEVSLWPSSNEQSAFVQVRYSSDLSLFVAALAPRNPVPTFPVQQCSGRTPPNRPALRLAYVVASYIERRARVFFPT